MRREVGSSGEFSVGKSMNLQVPCKERESVNMDFIDDILISKSRSRATETHIRTAISLLISVTKHLEYSIKTLNRGVVGGNQQLFLWGGGRTAIVCPRQVIVVSSDWTQGCRFNVTGQSGNDLTGQSRSGCNLCGIQLCKPGSEAVQWIGYGESEFYFGQGRRKKSLSFGLWRWVFSSSTAEFNTKTVTLL